MTKMIEWIRDNAAWVFSGIGVFALTALLYAAGWAYRRFIRSDPNKEQVRVKMFWSTAEGFYVDVYNSGGVAVYVKEVALKKEMVDDSKKPPFSMSTMSISLRPLIELPVADGGSVNVAVGAGQCDILPRKQVRFALPRTSSDLIRRLTDGRPEALFLAVSTFSGEIHRVPGNEVRPMLLRAIAVWEVQEEAERPKVVTVHFHSGQPGQAAFAGSLRACTSKRRSDGQTQVQLMDVTPGLAISDQNLTLLARDWRMAK